GSFWRGAASGVSGGRAQIFAQDFAERIFGQRVDELDMLGTLEARKPRTAELGELLLGHGLFLAHDDEGLDDLPPLDGGHPDHGAFIDRRMAHEHGLDFRGSNIFAAADDHVVLAAGEKDVAAAVEPSEIARGAPSVGQSRVVVAPGIALHDSRGADDYFADLAGGNEVAVLVADANLDIGERQAYRVEALEFEFDLLGRALDSMIVGAEHGQR